jgi:glycosyltransferase involved in cell wall biosynthesis
VQYTNPAGYPPLQHSSRILAGKGWRVLFLGIGVQGAEALRFPEHPNVRVRLLAAHATGWRQRLRFVGYCAWVLAWALWWRPRWVYASDSFSCPAALLLSLLPGMRVLYHEHDPPPEDGNALFRLCLWARRRLARRAVVCVLPSRARIEHFRDRVGREGSLCVWNCPALEELAGPRPPHDGDLWVLYHGSIVPARLPEAVIHALTRLPAAVKLRVIGYETAGHLGYARHLEALAARLGVADRLEVRGPVPRHELFDWCRRCDVGLALWPKGDAQPMTGASNKPFDYLACGLALLVSDLSDWQALFVKPGYALACDSDDAASIAAALRQFLEEPTQARAMGEAGRQRIRSEWNYEDQFAPVLARLEGHGR